MTAKLSPRSIALFVLAASVLALTSAYVAQYGFGLRPCKLCLIQRVPFALAGGLAALTLVFRAMRPRLLLGAAGIIFMVNSGIAFYHVGVERKWWASSCAPTENGALDLSNLKSLMTKPVEARCDEPAWQWNGITMAAMNIAFSGGLALVTLVLVRRMETKG